MALARYVFGITFVDFAGRMHNQITRVAVVAGAGYNVEQMQTAEAKGAQAYLTGEILDRIDNDHGRRLFKEVQDYARATGLSLIGVSHAASEFLVMKTHVAPWLRATFSVDAEVIPLGRWWR
jgi:putative NIF3 family GTP cyclohydrolase 1 type 2